MTASFDKHEASSLSIQCWQADFCEVTVIWKYWIVADMCLLKEICVFIQWLWISHFKTKKSTLSECQAFFGAGISSAVASSKLCETWKCVFVCSSAY